MLVLLPTYSTVVTDLTEWDKYTLMNVLAGNDEEPKYRLWVTAVFGYVFAAYFCQLLFTEYHNFSLQRLHYLAQVRESPVSKQFNLYDKYQHFIDHRFHLWYFTNPLLKTLPHIISHPHIIFHPHFIFITQADLASPDSDPDTLPQKYYTVMIERIPSNLRSAEKLYEYFEELFPG